MNGWRSGQRGACATTWFPSGWGRSALACALGIGVPFWGCSGPDGGGSSEADTLLGATGGSRSAAGAASGGAGGGQNADAAGAPGRGGVAGDGGSSGDTGEPSFQLDCDDGLKACGGLCVRPAPPIGCALEGCDACPVPENGRSVCRGSRCDFACDDGFVASNGRCASLGLCANGMRDGAERGVDCGGTCPPCADAGVGDAEPPDASDRGTPDGGDPDPTVDAGKQGSDASALEAGSDAGICVPRPRAEACQGLSCGSVSDGCEGAYACGGCVAPNTCGGGGLPNVCGCHAKTCSEVTCSSSPIADGCGGQLSCACDAGSCPGEALVFAGSPLSASAARGTLALSGVAAGCGDATRGGVFQFVAPASGRLRLNLSASFSAGLALRTGTCDTGESRCSRPFVGQPSLQVDVTQGTSYYVIVVGGFGAAPATGTYDLTLSY